MRKTAWLLVVVTLLSVLAGCASQGPSSGTNTSASTASDTGVLFDEPVTFTMMIIEHATYPYQKDAFLQKAISEKYNVNFEVTALQDGFVDKFNLGLASGELPDLIFGLSTVEATKAGYQGALVDFNQYRASMPNYVAWAEQQGDYEQYFFSGGGEMFSLPNLGYGEAGNPTFWIYRQDLFEKHNLAVPTTDAELYEVCKKLKEYYPDSTPFANRSYLDILDRIAYQWGSGYPMYYSNEQSKWVYGPTEDNFKECLIFLNKMFTEGLMPSNSLTLDTKGWQDLISTNKGFIFSDYIARIDYYNTPMRAENPDFTLAFMTPFKGGSNGTDKFNPQTMLIISGMCAFSGSKQVDNIVKYMDSRYTEAAEELMSWGIEGESYEVRADGKKYHKDIAAGAGYFEAIIKYGFYQRGFYTLVDPWSMLNTGSEETITAADLITKYKGDYRVPSISFTAESEEAKTLIETNLNSVMQENVSKFIMGQRSFSEWDQYTKELEALKLSELVEIYNKAYQDFLATVG